MQVVENQPILNTNLCFPHCLAILFPNKQQTNNMVPKRHLTMAKSEQHPPVKLTKKHLFHLLTSHSLRFSRSSDASGFRACGKSSMSCLFGSFCILDVNMGYQSICRFCHQKSANQFPLALMFGHRFPKKGNSGINKAFPKISLSTLVVFPNVYCK